MKFCFNRKDFIETSVDAEKLAVVGDNNELTWNEFKRRVDALCNDFSKNGFDAPAYPVIIYGHKSSNMLVAIYAMMKLEIPYIPVDIVYPKERIEKIASISKCQLVINTTEESLNIENTTELPFNGETSEIAQQNNLDLRESLPTDPLVYIIFTSGSTGEPKGVQISTEAVQSFTRWMTSDFNYSDKDVFINTAVLSFDLSVFEVMTFGAIGGTLLLNSKEQSSQPESLISRIEKYNGSVWVSTPSFALIYSRIKDEPRMNSVRSFLFCGEVLPHDLAQKLLLHYPNANVINTYGPTEATVATTLVEITQDVLDQHNPLPVGKSKRESQLLIENGEIVIVGPNVSLGYMNNEELNRQKFTKINGLRAFKTGDNGYLEDGMLFFSGRNDDLVKLHGYRIELNEISSAINDLNYVLHGETIALKRNGQVKKIVSLVKLVNSESGDANTIKTDISATLPHYMIPSDIMFVDEIPLNQNGKADKKLLTEMYMKR